MSSRGGSPDPSQTTNSTPSTGPDGLGQGGERQAGDHRASSISGRYGVRSARSPLARTRPDCSASDQVSVAGGQRQPGPRVGLDDRGRGAARVADAGDGLHRGVRRHPHLDRTSRRAGAEHRQEVLDQQPGLSVGAGVCGQRLRPRQPAKLDGVGRAPPQPRTRRRGRVAAPRAARRCGPSCASGPEVRHFSIRSVSSPDSFWASALVSRSASVADGHQAVLLSLGVLGAVDGGVCLAHPLPAEHRHRSLAARLVGELLEPDTGARVVDGLPDPVALVTGGLGRLDDQVVLRELAQMEARLVGGDLQAFGQVGRAHRTAGPELVEDPVAHGMGDGAQHARVGDLGQLGGRLPGHEIHSTKLRTHYCARLVAHYMVRI